MKGIDRERARRAFADVLVGWHINHADNPISVKNTVAKAAAFRMPVFAPVAA